jgi:hypothetical protein
LPQLVLHRLKSGGVNTVVVGEKYKHSPSQSV